MARKPEPKMGENCEEMENKCEIIVNDLLCWFQNHIDYLNVDIMVQLFETKYKNAVIENAKDLLFDKCHTDGDQTKRIGRRGEHKSDRHLMDIYHLFQEKGRSDVPIFVARDLMNLPPINLKDVNVSNLLHDVKSLRTEVQLLKDSLETKNETVANCIRMTAHIG